VGDRDKATIARLRRELADARAEVRSFEMAIRWFPFPTSKAALLATAEVLAAEYPDPMKCPEPGLETPEQRAIVDKLRAAYERLSEGMTVH
jgi:hypothetical protein